MDVPLLSKRHIDGEDFAIFCGLLRKHELYHNFPTLEKVLKIVFGTIFGRLGQSEFFLD